MMSVCTTSWDRGVWILRPVLWFATAYTIIIIFHEAAHALAAYVLGPHPTLFQFWVSYDFSRATQSERGLVGVAGPIVSLVVGLAFWFAYRRAKSSQAGLPLCYLAAVAFQTSSVTSCLLSLWATSQMPQCSSGYPTARCAASFVGAVSVSAILFATGREIRQWTPGRVGRVTAGICAIVVPTIIGTAIIVLINQPVSIPISFGAARAGESSFWVFASHRNTGDAKPPRC
jgi:hypothetical protein